MITAEIFLTSTTQAVLANCLFRFPEFFGTGQVAASGNTRTTQQLFKVILLDTNI